MTHLDSSHHVGLLTVRRAAGMCRSAAKGGIGLEMEGAAVVASAAARVVGAAG